MANDERGKPWTIENSRFEEADIQRSRKCVDCGTSYSIADYLPDSSGHFGRPDRYSDGCTRYCLACWLGVGPEPEETDEIIPRLNGDVLRELGPWLAPGIHLVIMPVARIMVEYAMEFPRHFVFYPQGDVDLALLNIIPNDKGKSLAHRQSASSGVDEEMIGRQATVAFPIEFDWDSNVEVDHRTHLE